ncbi:MAG: hypothetical protein QW318_07700 [Candidatus Caldarchaeum sp.]
MTYEEWLLDIVYSYAIQQGAEYCIFTLKHSDSSLENNTPCSYYYDSIYLPKLIQEGLAELVHMDSDGTIAEAKFTDKFKKLMELVK